MSARLLHSAPPLLDVSPGSRRPPAVGHKASPNAQNRELANLVRQISSDWTSLDGARLTKSASPARPPLGRVDSPNTLPDADEEVAALIPRQPPLKRGRSLGGGNNRGSRQSPLATGRRSTPSPMHVDRRQRAGASPVAMRATPPLPPRAGWAAQSDVMRPPPIHTSISLCSLESWDDVAAAVEPLGGPLPSPVADGDVAPAWRPPVLALAPPAPSLSLSTPSLAPPPSLGLIIEDLCDEDGSSGSAPFLPPPPTPGGARSGFGGFGGFGGARSFGGSARAGIGAHPPPVPPMSLVAPHIYVGDEEAAASLPSLRAAGVTHILNCCTSANPLEDAYAAPHYLRLNLMDNPTDAPRMPESIAQGTAFVDSALKAGGTVLIHCRAGISRSATIAIAYLVRATQQPVDVVFERVRARRRVVDPNLSYRIALHEWERRVLPPSALRANGARATPPAVPTPSPPRVRPLSRVG